MVTRFLTLPLVEKVPSRCAKPRLPSSLKEPIMSGAYQEVTFNKSLQHWDQDSRPPDPALPFSG